MIDEKKLIEDVKKFMEGSLAQLSLFTLSRRKVEQFIETKEDLISIIEQQPKTDWIPCEVDMPKELGRYIVTLKDGRSLEAIYDNVSKRFIMYEHEVIAWQPLPQPYKKEGAENG